MFPEGASERETPVGADGTQPVPGAGRWRYRPFELDEDERTHTVTLVRDDGVEVAFTVPRFIEEGDELGEIARVVIRARERWEELQGLGA